MTQKKELQKTNKKKQDPSKYLNAHDRAFKAALAYPKVARDLIKAHIPSFIAEQTRWASVKPCKESFLEPRMGDRFVDALFSAQFKKGKGYFYVLCEAQSKPDKLMVIRLWEYILRVIRNHLKQYGPDADYPIVVPVLVSNHTGKYPYSTDLLDYFGENKALAEKILYQPFKLVDLSRIPDEELKAHQWAGLLELCLKHSRDPKLVAHFKEHEIFSIVRQLDNEDKVVGYVANMLKYIIYSVDTKHKMDISDEIIKELPEYREIIMSLGQRIEKRAHQEGVQVGIEQGEKNRACFIARNLLADGMTMRKVQQTTGLTYKEIKRLKDELED